MILLNSSIRINDSTPIFFAISTAFVLQGEIIEDFGPINFSSIISLLIIGELSAQDIFSKFSADNFTEVSTANTFDFESPKNNIISEY